MILPITPKEETRAIVLEACDKLAVGLRAKRYAEAPLEVEVDRRELGGGTKNWDWIKKGVPIRIEIGPRDLEAKSLTVSRRDQPVKAKESMALTEFSNALSRTPLPTVPSTKPSSRPLKFLPSRTTTTSMSVVPSSLRVKL